MITNTVASQKRKRKNQPYLTGGERLRKHWPNLESRLSTRYLKIKTATTIYKKSRLNRGPDDRQNQRMSTHRHDPSRSINSASSFRLWRIEWGVSESRRAHGRTSDIVLESARTVSHRPRMLHWFEKQQPKRHYIKSIHYDRAENHA